MTADREKISELHALGFSCAQIVSYFCRDLSGVDEKTALAAMGAFGGGLRCGEVCGSVCGGAFALGMCYPHSEPDDKKAKATVTQLINALTEEFTNEFGALACRDILKERGSEGCEELMARTIELTHEITERD